MSGPKDFRVSMSAVRRAEAARRLAAMAQAREEELRQRAAANRARLEEASRTLLLKREEQEQAARNRHSAIASQRQEQIALELAELARLNRAKLESQQQMLRPNSASDHSANIEEASPVLTTATTLQTQAAELVQEPVPPGVMAGQGAGVDLQSQWSEVLTWREALRADVDVRDFEEGRLKQWEQLCEHCEQLVVEGASASTVAATLQSLTTEAKAIHTQAGDSAMQFTTRNELLADIIGSLKEVGFVVADPEFEDAANPAGPILLVATRGQERMEATIDLSDHIRSTWNNLESNHCASSFREYMDRMHNRGIEVVPDREDLRERPIEIQKGALDLPRSQHKPA